MKPWTVTVAVSASHHTAQGSSIEVCEGPNDHHCRLSGRGYLPWRRRDLRNDAQDRQRVIERAQAGGVRPPPKERVRNFEVVADLVAARVKKSAGRITAKRLLPAARTAGYEGSARNFRRLVAAAKKDWRAEHHRGRRPAIWSPGEHLVIDWGTQGGVHVFCAVLAWSRWRFVRFAADE